MRLGSTPYWFIYNFDFDSDLIRSYGKSIGLSLSSNMNDLDYMHMSVFSLMKHETGCKYNHLNWDNNLEVDSLKKRLIFYNYEYYNKVVNNKIKYIHFHRDILEESCLLYIKKHTIKTKIIDNDRLMRCYKECMLIRNIWRRYLSDYGKLYILELNLSDDIDYNLFKISRFTGRLLNKIEFNVEIDERLEILKKRLKRILVN